jgi:hypothetical protein
MIHLTARILRFVADRLDPPKPQTLVFYVDSRDVARAMEAEIARMAAMN